MRNLIAIILILCLLQVNVFSKKWDWNPDLQYWRHYDKSGINVFETGKNDTIGFDHFKMRIGGSFALQFQALQHSNSAIAVYDEDSVNLNALREIGPGFNNPSANLNLDVQLADGIRMSLVTYLSSRHHPEAWVKGGYLQIDKLAFLKSAVVDKVMKYVSIKVGHMEINYGDAHFRRSDNGNALYNPFIENYIMDAFTTEIGGEFYFHYKGFLAMAAISSGEIHGDVTKPDDRKPSYYGKFGYDRQFTDNLRGRLTGSVYYTASSVNNTLYFGDRAGSRYYSVMDNTLTAGFTNGRFSPGFSDKVTAFVVNPFIKFHGLELFANIEQARGRSATETENRTWTQYGVDLLYRFPANENFYIGGRFNRVNGDLSGTTQAVSIQRFQAAAGWFIINNILVKLEYVYQTYNDFPEANIYNGGKFKGIVLEGVIAF